METNKQYSIYTFEAKDSTINGKYFVAANDENSAKEYVNKINHTVSPIKLNIETCTEFKNLKYICPYWNNGIDAICIINALNYLHY